MAATDDTGVSPLRAETPAHDPVPGWLVALCAVLLVGVAALLFVVFASPVQKRVNDAKPGRLEIERWTERARSAPNDPASHLGLGYAYQQAGETDHAIAEYDRALALRPKDPAALCNKGVILLSTGRVRAGEDTLWQVLRAYPEHVMAAKALGQHYAKAERWELVLEAVRPAAASRPELADLHYLVGLAYERTGERARARGEYTGALRFAPDMREAAEGLERVGE